MKKYFMYIVQCNNNAYYVGSTDNRRDRVKKHNLGQGAEYTKKYKLVKLVYFEEYATRAEAEKRERQIKGWSRAKKEKLIKGEWKQIYKYLSLASHNKKVLFADNPLLSVDEGV